MDGKVIKKQLFKSNPEGKKQAINWKGVGATGVSKVRLQLGGAANSDGGDPYLHLNELEIWGFVPKFCAGNGPGPIAVETTSKTRVKLSASYIKGKGNKAKQRAVLCASPGSVSGKTLPLRKTCPLKGEGLFMLRTPSQPTGVKVYCKDGWALVGRRAPLAGQAEDSLYSTKGVNKLRSPSQEMTAKVSPDYAFYQLQLHHNPEP